MSAISYESQAEGRMPPEDGPVESPGRPRRQFFNRKTAGLAAVIACLAGLFAGVRIEKTQLSSTASAATPAAASTGAAGAAGARPGFAGAFRGGGGGGGANVSFGSVSSVNGNTIYLTDSSGNTVKVKLSSATKITKSQPVSKTSVRPGDTVVIQGVKVANGTISAASVSDSGASASRPAAGTQGSTSTPNSTGTSG